MNDPFKDEAICVIGVSGFIGSHVAAELLRQGYSVRGTSRTPDDGREWLEQGLGELVHEGASFSLHAANLHDQQSLENAMTGCTGVVMSAGVEHQDPNTVSLMLAAAANTLKAADRVGIDRVVFTSSTGSCNPPGEEPPVKKENEHWSDPGQQISLEKYSPAAKTLMEKLAVGLGDRLGVRVGILNPSLIVGPAFQPELPSSIAFLGKVLRGERMAEEAPNGSMSIIDVRDLAALHVAVLQHDSASGRYFGVKQSWHWQEILEALGRAHSAYAPPEWRTDRERNTPTGYDLTRQNTLGVSVRGLDSIVTGAVEELQNRNAL
jgi:dihydroflavonol-4-reductase